MSYYLFIKSHILSPPVPSSLGKQSSISPSLVQLISAVLSSSFLTEASYESPLLHMCQGPLNSLCMHFGWWPSLWELPEVHSTLLVFQLGCHIFWAPSVLPLILTYGFQTSIRCLSMGICYCLSQLLGRESHMGYYAMLLSTSITASQYERFVPMGWVSNWASH